MKNIFDQLKARFAKAGASIEVTLQSIALGAQHSTTGQYLKGYTPSTISMILIAKATHKMNTPVGELTQIEAIGLTDTHVYEGDEIEDADGNTFLIEKATPQKVGDQQVYYECALRSTLPYAEDRPYVYPAPPTESGLMLNVGVSLWDASKILSTLITSTDSTKKTATITTILGASVV